MILKHLQCSARDRSENSLMLLVWRSIVFIIYKSEVRRELLKFGCLYDGTSCRMVSPYSLKSLSGEMNPLKGGSVHVNVCLCVRCV